MSMSIKASPDGTFGEILVNGAVVAKLPVSGNAVIPGLVGTVSQSGGVPTGAIIERGSNANGDYVRFADGTQVCTKKAETPGTTPESFQWPAAFTSAVYSATANSSFSTTASDITIKFSGLSASGGNILATVNGVGTATVGYTAIAIGRWY